MALSLRQLGKKIGIILASSLLLLLVLEFTLRMAGYADFAAVYYDPTVGLRYYPNQRRHMLTGTKDLGTMDINEWGFRSPSFKLVKPGGVCRILCLGDSFTLGWGVDDAHTYPRVLQSWCDEHIGTGRVEVLNCGQPDFNTVNEERLYRTVVRKFSPDVVVLGYVLNDLAPETVGPINMNSRLEYLVGSTAIMRFLRQHLWHRLGIYQYGDTSENRRRRTEFAANEHEILCNPDGEIGRSYWSVSMSALSAIAGEVRQDGSRLLLVSFPNRGQLVELFGENGGSAILDPGVRDRVSAPQRRLGLAAQELGIPFLDLLDPFIANGLSSYSDLDKAHPSASGYQIMGQRIGATIQHLGLCVQDAVGESQDSKR